MANSSSLKQGSLDYQVMRPIWDFIEVLYSGNLLIQNDLDEYLIQYSAEDDNAYQKRKETAYYDNFLKKQVNEIVDLPFSKAITVPESFDKVYFSKRFLDNIDGRGTSLTPFCKEWFRASFLYGVSGVLVDNPATGDNRTLQEDQRTSPSFKLFQPKYIKGVWGYFDEYGEYILDRVWLETSTSTVTQSGDQGTTYEESSTQNITEFSIFFNEDGSRAVLQRDIDITGRSPLVVSERVLDIDVIPFVLFYTSTKKEGLYVQPETYDLAKQNKAHFNQLSDKTNIIKVTNYPQRYALGLASQEEIENLRIAGSNYILYSQNVDAKFGYLEHTGRAIESGAAAIKELEEKMKSFSGDFLTRAAVATATQVANESQTTSSHIQSLISSFENSIRAAVNIALKYRSIEPLEDKFQIFSEFSILNRASDKAKQLQNLYSQGAISLETYLTELKKIQYLSEDLDIKEEIMKVEQERVNDFNPPVDNPLQDDEDNVDDGDDDEDDQQQDDEQKDDIET